MSVFAEAHSKETCKEYLRLGVGAAARTALLSRHGYAWGRPSLWFPTGACQECITTFPQSGQLWLCWATLLSYKHEQQLPSQQRMPSHSAIWSNALHRRFSSPLRGWLTPAQRRAQRRAVPRGLGRVSVQRGALHDALCGQPGQAGQPDNSSRNSRGSGLSAARHH